MSHESIVKDLEARQAEIQESIQNAVRYSGESMKLRQELKGVQAKLQTARNDVATMQAAGRHAAASVTAQAGDALAGAAVDRIIGGAAPFAEILANGVSALDFTGAPAVTAEAHNLAAAFQRVSDAEAEHESAVTELNELSDKAAAKRERHAELLRQRAAGNAGEGSHAELYAVGEDIRTLDEMHAAAKAKAGDLLQPVHEARNALKGAEKQAATIEHRLVAEHLAAHVKALDAALVACLRACQAEGSKSGLGIGVLVQVSLDLRTFVSTGAIPAPFRRA